MVLAAVLLMIMGAALLSPSFLRNRDTRLCVAAHLGDLTAVERLIASGADVNGSRSQGFSKWHSSVTPLHFAARTGDPVIVQYLLEHGADPGRRAASGHTPLDFASSRTVEQLLREANQALQPTRPRLDVSYDP
jgi:ankyrin repeat protein